MRKKIFQIVGAEDVSGAIIKIFLHVFPKHKNIFTCVSKAGDFHSTTPFPLPRFSAVKTTCTCDGGGGIIGGDEAVFIFDCDH